MFIVSRYHETQDGCGQPACRVTFFKEAAEFTDLFDHLHVQIVECELVEDLDAKEVCLRGASLSWLKETISIGDTHPPASTSATNSFIRRYAREDGVLRPIRFLFLMLWLEVLCLKVVHGLFQGCTSTPNPSTRLLGAF